VFIIYAYFVYTFTQQIEGLLFLCRSQNKGRGGDRSDIFKDSLSEGLKAEKSSSDEEQEIGDINIEEDEDEEQIIQKRRKQREELLKVNFAS
jgi:serine/threonine-protein kinase PRP4